MGAVAAVGIGLTIAAPACSSSHGSAGSTTSTTGRSLSVSTPDGTVTLSLNGQLPPTWPSGFPLPPGAAPAGSGSVSNSSGVKQVAVFQVSGTGLQAFDFYKRSETLTVHDAKSAGSGSKFVGRLKFTGQYTGSVTVTDVSSRTLVIVTMTSSAQ